MSDIKISELPQVTSMGTGDILPTVTSNVTSKITLQDFAAALPQVSSSITASYALNSGGDPFPYTGDAVITGSLYVTGSSNFSDGFLLFQQVSQSLNFVDDAAAAAGGVPLGGVYRSGNVLLIRMV